MITIKRALCLSALFLPAQLLAQHRLSDPSASPEINPFLDPAVQDYVETSYGYLNPKYTPGLINDFRDSPTSLYPAAGTKTPPPAADKPQLKEGRLKESPAPGAGDAAVSSAKITQAAARPETGQHYKVTFAGESGPISSCVNPLSSGAISGFRAGDYAFISVLPKTEGASAVIASLAADGFRLSGEKTYFTAEGKKTFVQGWVTYPKLERIYKNPLVQRVAVEKKSPGAPFLTRIRFTLRAPSGDNSAVFVADFVRNLGASAGFSAENISRLPKAYGGAKFTAFEVTGSLPADMASSVSLSPFVAAMEFQDKSL